MSLDLESMGQLSLLEEGRWRSIISVEPDHRLVVLCKSIPWLELMEKARPILYDEQGIAWDTFFAKDMVTKTQMIQKAKAVSEVGLEQLSQFLPRQSAFDRLQKRTQYEILRLIAYWLKTHKVAPDKIISLWKLIPALCHRISITAQNRFRRNVFEGQFGTLLKFRNQEDRNPTERKSPP